MIRPKYPNCLQNDIIVALSAIGDVILLTHCNLVNPIVYIRQIMLRDKH